MIIQLPTGKTANVDTAWWLGLSDDQIQAFYDRDYGSDIDPLSIPIPMSSKVLDDTHSED